MTAAPRPARPHSAPAYYLGRPASWWIATAVGRRPGAGPRRAAAQAAQHAGAAVADPGAVYRQAIGAGLVVHRADPLNAETPLAALAGQTIVPPTGSTSATISPSQPSTPEHGGCGSAA